MAFSSVLALLLAIATFLTPQPAFAGTPSQMGQWERVPLFRDGTNIRQLQSVHTTLLPNKKVLVVNGSSNRNRLVGRDGDVGDIQDGVNAGDSAVVDNTALFDPVTKEFTIIDSPLSDQNNYESNDLFCSGHVHLDDGNVFFMGGSARYYPGEKFAGSKQTNIYHWETGTWSSPGLMHEGRWYPSPVVLADGKVAIFSGLKDGGGFVGTNRELDVYDPDTDEIHNIDLSKIPGNPFKTFITEYQYHNEDGDVVTVSADAPDNIDIYPRIFQHQTANC